MVTHTHTHTRVFQNEWTRAQTVALLGSASVSELQRRFCATLTFGTAGLRAPMGAGFSRINDLTVIQSTQVSVVCLCVYVVYFILFFKKNICVCVAGLVRLPAHVYSRCGPQRRGGGL